MEVQRATRGPVAVAVAVTCFVMVPLPARNEDRSLGPALRWQYACVDRGGAFAAFSPFFTHPSAALLASL